MLTTAPHDSALAFLRDRGGREQPRQGDSNSRPRRRSVIFSINAASASGLIGLCVLLGYALGWPQTWQPIAGGPSTHPWTAVSLVVLGFAVLMAGSRHPSRGTAVLAVLAAAVAVGRLTAGLVGHPGLFQTFSPFAQTLAMAQTEGRPIGMGVNSAVTILLLATSLLLLRLRRPAACQVAALAAAFLPMVAMIGYIYGAPGFYGAMALPTLSAALLSAFAILCLTAHQAPLRYFLSFDIGGRLARVQMIAFTSGCFGLGLVAARYQIDLGPKALAAEVTSIFVIILGVVTYSAYQSGQLSLKRVRPEEMMNSALSLDLAGAGERGELSIRYQPQIDLVTNEVIGVEALARWHHPVHGQVSPAMFIPLAEVSGQIVSLGIWILEVACRQAMQWHSGLVPGVNVSVNVSPIQLNQDDFVEAVKEVLRSTNLPPGRLVLEVTEGAMVKRGERAFQSLRELRQAGVHIAIDDFGTGYSSLSYLKDLPSDYLKIDQSFVRELPGDNGAAAIARAIVAMGRSLGLRIVAEGIETREQAEFLQSIWCDEGQGYYYGRPMTADELSAWTTDRALSHTMHSSSDPASSYD